MIPKILGCFRTPDILGSVSSSVGGLKCWELYDP